jgi:protein involved in polysaccharide export with SLBB domain
MRHLLVVCLLFINLFAVELSPEQIMMAKQAGISQSQIDSAIAQKEQASEQSVAKEQVVQNDVVSTTTKVEPTDTKAQLQRFGSQFFNNKNKINPYSMPTPSNYILNYEDKLNIVIYGATNENFKLSINNNGNVTIPLVGELKLIGKTFEEAKTLIEEEVKKAYPNSTNILVDISEFTSIQVTISGLVNAPGLYNLTSFSTIKDAILNSGGILPSGSYRNISLKRDGKVIKNFDLYELIRYGKNSSDMTLKNGDIIVVNPVSKQVSIKGFINNPAIYELRSYESYKNLINFTTGFKPKANTKAIKLKRYENNSIKVLSLNKEELYKLKPKNGDEIVVSQLSAQNANLVTIVGNVFLEGEVQLPKDKKITTLFKDLLDTHGQNGFFKKDTRYEFAMVEDIKGKVKSFSLKDVLDGTKDFTISAGDIINIYKKQSNAFILVNGDIVNPSKRNYDYIEGMKAKDLFEIVVFDYEKVEGDNKKLRYPDSRILVNRFENNIKKSYSVDTTTQPDFLIKEYDEIVFFDYDKANDSYKATIKGEIFIPGTYNITKNTTIKDLVNLAGGFTKKSLLSRAELARYETKGDERIRTIIPIDLNKAFDLNLQIFPDDEWTIFAIKNWNEKKYIDIKGEVRFPGRYSIAEGEKLSSVLARAGGFTKHAFVEGSVFTREEVKQLQQRRLDDSLDRLRTKALQISSSANEAGESLQSKQNMVSTVAQLEKEASRNKPIGRISLNLYLDLQRFQNSPFDLTLKDQDSLYIPSINDTISVVGEVLNQNTFVYEKDLDAKDYLAKAGGTTELADEEYIYIVKANGEAKRVKTDYFWGNSNDVFKGDTIVVPMMLDPVSDISFAKDVSSIVYQLAVTAASIKTIGGL